MPSAPGVGRTFHPKLGAAERRPALLVNFLTSLNLRKSRALSVNLLKLKTEQLKRKTGTSPVRIGTPASSEFGRILPGFLCKGYLVSIWFQQVSARPFFAIPYEYLSL